MDPNVFSEARDDSEKCQPRIIEVERLSTNGCQGSEVSVIVPQKSVGEEAVVVWDAALVLAHFLEFNQSQLKLNHPKRKHVIDVGAGTGAVGLVASALGANVTLTDLRRILPLLEEGVSVNKDKLEEGGKFLRVIPLEWGQTEDLESVCVPEADLIVVSDCVYYEKSVAPLIFTLRELVRRSANRCPVIVCYEERDYLEEKKRIKDNFMQLASRDFNLTFYTATDCHPQYSSDDIKVIRMDII